MSQGHGDDDKSFLESVPSGLLRQFRDENYNRSFIDKNPQLFLDTDWIKVSRLREFIRNQGNSSENAYVITSSPPPTRPSSPSRSSDGFHQPFRPVKPEPADEVDLSSSPMRKSTVRTRAYTTRNHQEVLEILSSDEEELFDGLGGAERVEYILGIPAIWPIFKVPTAIVLDLRDPKFHVVIGGRVLSPDALIKNKDQDSWKGGSGSADSSAEVYNVLGSERVTCRRSRLQCTGCFACQEVDPALLNVTRYELDPAPRDAIFATQMQTRTREGTTADLQVTTFWNMIHSKSCSGRDSDGDVCVGKPTMKVFRDGATKRGKRSFISCSGFTPTFRDHRTHSIPDYISEDKLAELFHTGHVQGAAETPPCSLVVSPHIGGKVKFCAFTHVHRDGKPIRSPIKHHPCPAKRIILVPHDTSLRMAVVIPASFETKHAYLKCIETVGAMGSSVKRIDNAVSTKLLLGGKTPAIYDPALHQTRLKRDLLAGAKLKDCSGGLGIEGVVNQYMSDLQKPPESRYIHKIVTTPTGSILIFTFEPKLAALIHHALSLLVDTTFKRAAGDLNEWEIVIWYPAINRTVTIGRVYTNNTDRAHYKLLFDEMQNVIATITGRPLKFKRLSRDGTLLTLNVDMEAAQVLGAGDSFMSTNEPEYSGILTTDSAVLVTYFTRVCFTHVKRPILDFKSLVSETEFSYLMNFPYINNDKELATFDAYCQESPHQKIRDWWAHKRLHDWIIPAIIKYKSRIRAEDWDITPATTNANEAQHHWTNRQTGIRLTLREAIQTARDIDVKTANEIEDETKNGFLGNHRNEYVHRMASNSQRATERTRKAKANAKLESATMQLQGQIEQEKEFRKGSMQRQKAWQVELGAMKDTKKQKSRAKQMSRVKPKRNSKTMDENGSSSCGRVSSQQKGKARDGAHPYHLRLDVTSNDPVPLSLDDFDWQVQSDPFEQPSPLQNSFVNELHPQAYCVPSSPLDDDMYFPSHSGLSPSFSVLPDPTTYGDGETGFNPHASDAIFDEFLQRHPSQPLAGPSNLLQ